MANDKLVFEAKTELKNMLAKMRHVHTSYPSHHLNQAIIDFENGLLRLDCVLRELKLDTDNSLVEEPAGAVNGSRSLVDAIADL